MQMVVKWTNERAAVKPPAKNFRVSSCTADDYLEIGISIYSIIFIHFEIFRLCSVV